jgi:hypothetical protein
VQEHLLWKFSRAFQDAMRARDAAVIAPLLDDEIDWAVFGPVDMFSFLGPRHGKADVINAFSQIADTLQLNRIERERTVLAENQASALLRCTFTLRATGRHVGLRLAHFTQFREDRVSSFLVTLDTFDLVQQALGEEIQLPGLA